MDIFDAIALRTATREFHPKKKIPPAYVEKILDATRWTPSPENVQHHRWIIVKDQKIKDLIADMAWEVNISNLQKTPVESVINYFWGLPENARAPLLEQFSDPHRTDYIKNAEYLLIPCINGRWYDVTYFVAPEAFGVRVTSLAVANLWTAATALGIGVSFLISAFEDQRRRMEIHDLLGVPTDWSLMGALAIGMPKHPVMKAPKFPLESIAFDNYWGRPWKRVGFRNNPTSQKAVQAAAKASYYTSYLDTFDAIYMRRSIRHFKMDKDGKPLKIPDWKIEMLLNSARMAASPGNTQPWRFVVVRDQEIKELIADAAQEHAVFVFGVVPYEMVSDRLYYIRKGVHPGIMEYMADGSLMRYPERASITILPAVNFRWTSAAHTFSSEVVGGLSISFAIMNIWNSCPALGLGLGYNALPTTDIRKQQVICDAVGIPRSWEVLTTLNIGIPATLRAASPSRFPLGSMIFNEYWGRRYHRIGFEK